ncbi:hypothetical protein DM02DRAFT_664187 [Periconia macrospinosa]|uniref:Uncharacterized protein n=1 Tax=Periconia macrospinosa TaxID=97972 RepID=A0A2V1CZS9_9PLEO|nr:hypothetical protein DM02DRAFT_664187 [Periconia macrospinosa]
MDRDLAIGYIVCLSCGVMLGAWLLLQDIRMQSRWGLAIAIFSSFVQIAPIIPTIVALAITFNPSTQLDWVDLAVACTFQSIVYTNLARLLRALHFPTWTTLLSHVAIFVVDIVDVFFYRYK